VATVGRPQPTVRVFVAGGSGVIGRALVPQLIAAGHFVAATTRAKDKIEMVRSLGATPVLLDALDADAVMAAVVEYRPDVVMNQLTALPKHYNPRRLRPSYEATSRLRVDATRILLRAAANVGARRFIYQSIAFMYENAGPLVLEEGAPLALNATEPFGALVRTTAEGERLATSAIDVTGVVLRYGQIYGSGTYFGPGGDFQRQARARMLPLVGSGAGLFSFLHVTDAAAAAVAALDRGSGVYNIVDDDPAAARDWIPEYCRELGAPPPLHVPAWIAKIVAGSFAVAALTDARGASNRKAKSELGWSPSLPSWRGRLAA
jgi:nucleoside-diphosphate-sugar epimerase